MDIMCLSCCNLACLQIDHAIVYPNGFNNSELEDAVNVALTEIKESGFIDCPPTCSSANMHACACVCFV